MMRRSRLAAMGVFMQVAGVTSVLAGEIDHRASACLMFTETRNESIRALKALKAPRCEAVTPSQFEDRADTARETVAKDLCSFMGSSTRTMAQHYNATIREMNEALQDLHCVEMTPMSSFGAPVIVPSLG